MIIIMIRITGEETLFISVSEPAIGELPGHITLGTTPGGLTALTRIAMDRIIAGLTIPHIITVINTDLIIIASRIMVTLTDLHQEVK